MVSGMILVDSSTTQMIEKWFHFREDSLRNIRSKANQDPHYYELLGTKSTAEAVKNNIEAKGVHPFQAIPMAVLTADHHNKDIEKFTPLMENDWQIFQHLLTQSSTNSYQIIAYKSGHFIQMDQPDLVIDAIYTMTRIKEVNGD